MAAKRLRMTTSEPRARGSLPSAWSWYANGPLKGCGLMRERQWIYAWDDANTIYLLDLRGELFGQRQASKEVVALAGDEIGESLVAASRMGKIWWLDSTLKPRLEIEVPFTPLGVAVDPLGNYAAISSQQGQTLICDRDGKKVAELSTTRPLKFLAFVPTEGSLIAAADQGLVCCFDSRGKNLWSTPDWSAVGSLAIDGDGSTILLSCFTHGIVRLDGDGHREGTYRFEHSPALVAIDFEGATILSASLERTVTQLTYEGNIKANRFIEDKPIGLQLDALGRYGVLGFGDGELRLIHLPEFFQNDSRRSVDDSTGDLPIMRSGGTEPVPAWESGKLANNLEEVDSAVLEWVPGTRDLALYTNRRTLRIIDEAGSVRHESNDLPGLGRVLTRGEQWLAAYNDRRLCGYNPASASSSVCTLPTTEISHVELFADPGELLLIESCEFVARVRLPDQQLWKRRLEYKVGTAAVIKQGDAAGWTALTLDDQNLLILDQGGKNAGKFRARPAEPLSVVSLNDGWATAARDSSVIRGHEPDGSLLWTRPTPWPPWGIRRLGPYLLVTSAEGYSLLLSQEGQLLKESREPREGAMYFMRDPAKVARLFVTGQTIIVTTFGGKLIWRHTEEHRIGPMLAGAAGVAVFIGKTLTFYPFE